MIVLALAIRVIVVALINPGLIVNGVIATCRFVVINHLWSEGGKGAEKIEARKSA